MGTVRVGRNTINPTHVFSLSDGDKTLGFLTCNRRGEISLNEGWRQSPMPRTALKMSQGQAKYEDFELPFTSIIQDSFEGGMNAEDFEDDRTRYGDGRHADTTMGDVLCGPMETKATNFPPRKEGSLSYEKWELESFRTPEFYQEYVSQIILSETMTVKSIRLPLMGPHVKVGIYTDNGGEPDTLVAQASESWISNALYDNYTLDLDTPYEMTAWTTYWIKAVSYYVYAGHINPNYAITQRPASGKKIMRLNADTAEWETYLDNHELAYLLIEDSAPLAKARFFEHRRCLYAIRSYDDNSTNMKLYQNGYRGAAKANDGALSLLKTGLDLSKRPDGSDLDLNGKIALIVAGPGALEEKPWRTIISNTKTGANDDITVDRPWKIKHTTGTSFVILGTDDWWEITSTGLGKTLTDVEIVYDYVAIAQGSGTNIRKFRWINNAGTGTNQFKDDGTNKADKLLMVADTEGKMKLWKALIDDNKVDWAEAKNYDTDHVFKGKDIMIGTSVYSDIKQLIAYGDPLIPYVIKEDSFGSIQNDIYAELPIGELKSARSEYNGTAAMMHGVYLYFNIGERIERYYDRRLDDVGPTRDEGMAQGRQGIIRKLLPYPGKYYALLYTEGNVPSILCYNGMGWNEVWRPTAIKSTGAGSSMFDYSVLDVKDEPSTDMIVQVIPGTESDRLWFDYAGDFYWVPVAINPRNEPLYNYRNLSQIETAWQYGNLKDVNKYWHSVKLHTEELEKYYREIKVEYKVDDDTEWNEVGIANTSPIEELILSPTYDVTGYRIKFRLTFATSTPSISPRLLALVVKGVIRVEVKKGWNVTCISENETDLNGDEDESGNLLEQLDLWANSESMAKPLTLRHNIGYYDDKRVFIDPASVALQQVRLAPEGGSPEREYKELLSFTMYEA
jgi:hypothetical protein